LFDLIHSVDSTGLAGEINKAAGRIGKVQKILIQVKLADEETKHGVSEKELMQLMEEASLMDHLSLEGLMTMPPYFDDPAQARPYFRRLGEIAENARARGFTTRELSMGMSHDFETAIEEGATMVRVGTAIFGERPRNRVREGTAGL
ncbi:MAG: YggS family pyridoxal phosphate-dependent enzyme, partial [Nitrospiraceae bacterium]